MKALPTSPRYPVLRPVRQYAGVVASVLVAAGLLMAPVGCSRKAILALPVSSNPTTEQAWVIGAVVKDLANMATFAATPEHWSTLPADAVEVRGSTGNEMGRAYTVSIKLPGEGDPIKSDLKITGSVWSPESYTATLGALFARLRIAPPAGNGAGASSSDAELLKALVNPFTAEIEAQNQRLSGRLQEHPLDAPAHEQAALLLGTLALRENSGLFWNPRGLCNRAAAHLSFARALRPEISECGEVAGLLIGLIIDTKADCQKRIAALQTQVAAHTELGPWVTAAALRNTRDYRLLADPKTATFLERVEQFRAMSEAISTDEAIKRELNHQPDNAPDWSRIVLQGDYGVGAGHQFALPSIGLEMNDAVQVFPALRTARAPDQFAAIFNLQPGDAVQPGEDQRAHIRVIDEGTWAQFFQRHLLQAADETYDFLQYKWGVPDEAKRFRVQMGSPLKRLTLYPLCLDFLGKTEGDALFPQAADLLKQHPQWVSDKAWAEVVKTVPPRDATGGSWSLVSQAWFSPRLPVGTAYGFDWRADGGYILPPPALPELQTLHDIAPLKYDVCRMYVNALAPNHHPTLEQYKQVMGPLLSYDLPAIWGVAWSVQNDPVQYGAAMTQAATLNPSYYMALGEYYVNHHMESEAAQAYQAGIDHEADPLTIAANSSWLVNYYYDHGQRDRAMTIAQQAADVYSFRGLETMAGLLERMGRTADAESYYEKINERYDDAKPLHLFYARAAATHPEYAEKMKAAEKVLFPQGIQEVSLAQLTGKPTKGVLVHGENALSRQAGLKLGAIVVGVDGKRVRNMNQYTYVRALKASPEMDLLVYQDEHYQAIHAQVPGRMFNLEFTSWP